jgi:tripartite-type tricarboxylate transporter receptor subunit TctC
MGIGSVAVFATHVAAGKLRAIAVTGDKRSPAMPEIATLAEQGYPGFSALAWWGVFAPAATPKAILTKFHGALVNTLNQPDLRKQLTEQLGMDLVVSEPAALQTFLLKEMERWGKVVREHGIKAD